MDVEEVVAMIYDCSTSRGEPGVTGWFLFEFFWGMKHSIPERTHSEIRAAVLAAACFKKFG